MQRDKVAHILRVYIAHNVKTLNLGLMMNFFEDTVHQECSL